MPFWPFQFRPRNPAATPVRKRPSLDFSLTGLVYCAMMLFMGMAAINTQANLLFGVFGLMIGVLLMSGVLSRKVLRRLKIRRVLPDHGVVGRPMAVTYQFTNAKRFWPSISVTAAELDGAEGFTKQPQSYLLHAAAGMTASVPSEFIPKRRGLHQFERFQISTSFPFGFIKRAANDRHRDTVLVYPPIATVERSLLLQCRAAEKTGATMRPRKGGADEFYGVKEHRAGENPRWIHWKRSARTSAQGVLVAREMTQVAPPRLLIVVDSHVRQRTTAEHTAVERAIAMAASLAATALEQDLSVGLLVWSNGYKSIEPSRGKRHRSELLSILAQLPLNTEKGPGDLLAEASTLVRTATTAVLITPRDDPPAPSGRWRDALVVVAANSPQAAAWFRFEQGVDFSVAMPADQQPAATPRRS